MISVDKSFGAMLPTQATQPPLPPVIQDPPAGLLFSLLRTFGVNGVVIWRSPTYPGMAVTPGPMLSTFMNRILALGRNPWRNLEEIRRYYSSLLRCESIPCDCLSQNGRSKAMDLFAMSLRLAMFVYYSVEAPSELSDSEPPTPYSGNDSV